ncbi:MAG: DCC1-like thiol-disulfide oxidoreductase family protein [Simkaniaceae bacterium]|nr:DCC1-like thiol-disulfide oxidoreductase family protein [Candidatus Sacchlamyda saccharinae]
MKKENKIVVFYDGDCGLCHSFVKFTIVRMIRNAPFLFAPQNGGLFKALCPYFSEANNPESIVVFNGFKNEVTTKTVAIILVLDYLRWPWKVFGTCLRVIPLSITNFFYDCVAKMRSKLSKKVEGACPIVAKEFKKYFEE